MMGKAVLISIRPKWCELIAIGKKTVEVRKTAPKLKPPFKCYIYETQGSSRAGNEAYNFIVEGSGRCKVIGEFVCDGIVKHWLNSAGCRKISEQSCVPASELHIYAQPHDFVYGWQISDLVIYDTPKKLSEFDGICSKKVLKDCECGACKRLLENGNGHCPMDSLKRAPQSWRYVEELA